MPTKTRTQRLVAASLAAALIAVLAQVAVPVGPIPVTLQTLGVALTGLTLGARDAAAALLLYLAAGLFLPVFAGGAVGPAVFLGPTAGFLLGFLPAAALIGALREVFDPAGVPALTLCCLAGSAVTHSAGFAGLTLGCGWPPSRALALQLPFLPWDLLKCLLAASAYTRIRPALPPTFR